MAKAQKQKLRGKQASLEIDLRELFGQRIPDSTAFREAVGQAIIDQILDNTEDNVDRLGKKFPKYSKEYIASLDFKAFGKSADDVNLALTGDMLGLLDITNQTRNTITIGWDDNEQSAKAHGHISGNVRKDGKKRDFLGISSEQIDDVADEFNADVTDTTEADASLFESSLVLFRDLFGDDDG